MGVLAAAREVTPLDLGAALSEATWDAAPSSEVACIV